MKVIITSIIRIIMRKINNLTSHHQIIINLKIILTQIIIGLAICLHQEGLQLNKISIMITIIMLPGAVIVANTKRDLTLEEECNTTQTVVDLHTITKIVIMIIIAQAMRRVRAITKIIIIIERDSTTVDSITMEATMSIIIANTISMVVAIINKDNHNMKNLADRCQCSSSQDIHQGRAISVEVGTQSVALPNHTTVKDSSSISLDNHHSKFQTQKMRLDLQKSDCHLCQSRVTSLTSLMILKVNIITITKTTKHRCNLTIKHPINYNSSSFSPQILPLQHT